MKEMLVTDQIPLSSYMTTMGAINMKMDAKTKLKLRQVYIIYNLLNIAP